jgi:hypothetical protein
MVPSLSFDALDSNVALSVTIVVLLLLPNASVGSVNALSSAAGSRGLSSSCLIEVPYDATIVEAGRGDKVTFANGTVVSHSLTSCVRAVHPDVYAIALNITANPRFIAAENGIPFAIEEYTYNGNFFYIASHSCTTTSRSGVGIVNPPECLDSTIVVFDTWSNESHSCCGYTIPFTQTGEIDVSIPFDKTGSPELANLTVTKSTTNLIGNLCLCTTQITPQRSTTVTATTCTTVTASVGSDRQPGALLFNLALLTVAAFVVAALVVYRQARTNPASVPSVST